MNLGDNNIFKHKNGIKSFKSGESKYKKYFGINNKNNSLFDQGITSKKNIQSRNDIKIKRLISSKLPLKKRNLHIKVNLEMILEVLKISKIKIKIILLIFKYQIILILIIKRKKKKKK